MPDVGKHGKDTAKAAERQRPRRADKVSQKAESPHSAGAMGDAAPRPPRRRAEEEKEEEVGVAAW